MTAADALAASLAEVERLRARIHVLEGVARLNGETIRSMQRAAAEAVCAELLHSDDEPPLRPHESSTTNGDRHASRQSPTHLLKLADREFRQLTEERPAPQPFRKFKPMKLISVSPQWSPRAPINAW